MGSRRKARELALQFLYQIEMNPEDLDSSLSRFWMEHRSRPEIQEYATKIITGTCGNLERIDPMLKDYTQNWALSRMAVVDRNILRLATYEMVLAASAPPIVVINEAVEIAKKYSTPDSGAFVNGILDRIRKERVPNGSEG